MMLSSKVISSNTTLESTIAFVPPPITESQELGARVDLDDGDSSTFVLDKTQEEISGIDKVNRSRMDTLVQKEVLLRLESLQEEAYAKGFELGREEGRVEALKEAGNQVEQDIRSCSELVTSIQMQYDAIAKQNEARIIDLIYKIASRLAAKTLELDSHAVAEVVKQTVSNVSSQDSFTLEIHPSLIQFFEELQVKAGREVEFMRKARIQPNENIAIGGCIVRTEFGQIDAQFETRVQNLWQNISQIIPQVS